MASPLFSVITITYNNRAGLFKTAKTVHAQTIDHASFEWIIVDGGSNDGTQDDFPNYAATRIISESDDGLYDAMNKGIAAANGQFIIFMNAGDQFANRNSLQMIADQVRDIPHDVDFIYGDSFESDGAGHYHYKRARSHRTILSGLFTHHQAMLYNRGSLGDLRYDLNYKIAADYDLTLRFFCRKPRRCEYIDQAICIFEGGGISQINVAQARAEQFQSRRANHIPLLINMCVRARQSLTSLLRKLAPALYWQLRGV